MCSPGALLGAPPLPPQAGLNPAELPMAMGEYWGVLLPPHPTSMPRGLLSWEGDRQTGSTPGSEQRFQAAPGFVPEHVCLKAHVCTHSHSPTHLHSYPHTHVTEKRTFSLIPRTHRIFWRKCPLHRPPTGYLAPSGSKHTCFRRCFPWIYQHFLTALCRPGHCMSCLGSDQSSTAFSLLSGKSGSHPATNPEGHPPPAGDCPRLQAALSSLRTGSSCPPSPSW